MDRPRSNFMLPRKSRLGSGRSFNLRDQTSTVAPPIDVAPKVGSLAGAGASMRSRLGKRHLSGEGLNNISAVAPSHHLATPSFFKSSKINSSQIFKTPGNLFGSHVSLDNWSVFKNVTTVSPNVCGPAPPAVASRQAQLFPPSFPNNRNHEDNQKRSKLEALEKRFKSQEVSSLFKVPPLNIVSPTFWSATVNLKNSDMTLGVVPLDPVDTFIENKENLIDVQSPIFGKIDLKVEPYNEKQDPIRSSQSRSTEDTELSQKIVQTSREIVKRQIRFGEILQELQTAHQRVVEAQSRMSSLLAENLKETEGHVNSEALPDLMVSPLPQSSVTPPSEAKNSRKVPKKYTTPKPANKKPLSSLVYTPKSFKKQLHKQVDEMLRK